MSAVLVFAWADGCVVAYQPSSRSRWTSRDIWPPCVACCVSVQSARVPQVGQASLIAPRAAWVPWMVSGNYAPAAGTSGPGVALWEPQKLLQGAAMLLLKAAKE